MTYILFSPSFNRFYIGSCQNLRTRIKQHNSGKTRSTKPYRPWTIIYQESFLTRQEAQKRERQIKSYKSGDAFKKLLHKLKNT